MTVFLYNIDIFVNTNLKHFNFYIQPFLLFFPQHDLTEMWFASVNNHNTVDTAVATILSNMLTFARGMLIA